MLRDVGMLIEQRHLDGRIHLGLEVEDYKRERLAVRVGASSPVARE